jgi:hypothetical protein
MIKRCNHQFSSSLGSIPLGLKMDDPDHGHVLSLVHEVVQAVEDASAGGGSSSEKRKHKINYKSLTFNRIPP